MLRACQDNPLFQQEENARRATVIAAGLERRTWSIVYHLAEAGKAIRSKF